MGCFLKGLGILIVLVIVAWLIGIFFGLLPSIGNLMSWRAPSISVSVSTPTPAATAPAAATQEPDETICEIISFNNKWVVIRPQDDNNTTLVALNLDDKSSAFIPYMGVGTGTLLAELPRRGNLMGLVHFSGTQYGTVLLYDLAQERELGRLQVDRAEVDGLNFATNGMTLLVDEEKEFWCIDSPTLTAVDRAKYDLKIKLAPPELGALQPTAEMKAAVNRIQLQDGTFCRLSK